MAFSSMRAFEPSVVACASLAEAGVAAVLAAEGERAAILNSWRDFDRKGRDVGVISGRQRKWVKGGLGFGFGGMGEYQCRRI